MCGDHHSSQKLLKEFFIAQRLPCYHISSKKFLFHKTDLLYTLLKEARMCQLNEFDMRGLLLHDRDLYGVPLEPFTN